MARAKLVGLYEHYGLVRSSLGGVLDGKVVFCGKDCTNDIAGRLTQTEAFLLWLLVREPSEAETRMMDTLITLNLYPDIRVWSMRAGAYAAACGAPISAAYAQAHAALNGSIFGVGASINFYRFMQKLEEEAREGGLDAAIEARLARRDFFPGFGRPLIQGPDERFVRLQALIGEWAWPKGRYLLQLDRAAELIGEAKGLYPNYASILVALLMDEPYGLGSGGISACAHFITNMPAMVPVVEIAGRPLGESLLPIKIDDVEYRGRPARPLPRREWGVV